MKVRGWFAALGSVAALGGTSLAAPPDDMALKAAFGNTVRVTRDGLTGAPRALFGLREATFGADPAARALRFLEASRRLLDLGPSGLVHQETRALPHGHVVRFAQTALGLPVEGRSLAVKLDAQGRVTSLTSDLVPFELARPAATIAPEQAQQVVRTAYQVAAVGTPTEVVLVSAPGHARIAWRVPVAVIPLQAHFSVWVDAESGDILREAPAGLDQVMAKLPRRSGGPR